MLFNFITIEFYRRLKFKVYTLNGFYAPVLMECSDIFTKELANNIS